MAIDEKNLSGSGEATTSKHKRTTFGTGLLKGLGITLRHLLSPAATMQYPDEKDDYPARSRGVIALKTENCTVCMLCARECPDWCIYIDGHKEAREPATEGKRAKKFNVLDRFAIDYALCMYCGICVEVCPYDALFWSPEFEYASSDIVELTHEEEKLNEWMYTVLPPPALDEGAEGPALKAAPAPPPGAAEAPPEAARTGGVPVPAEADAGPKDQAPTVTPAPSPQLDDQPAGEAVDPDEVHKKVLEEELAKGSDPRVAEGRAKSAALKARRGAPAKAAPAAEAPPKAEAPAAEAPPKAEAAPAAQAPEAGQAAEQAPAKAPAKAAAAPSAPKGPPPEPRYDPDLVYKAVLKDQLAAGNEQHVAEARAKTAAARVREEAYIYAAAGVAPASPDPKAQAAPEAEGAPAGEGAAKEKAAPAGEAAPKAEATTADEAAPKAEAAPAGEAAPQAGAPEGTAEEPEAAKSQEAKKATPEEAAEIRRKVLEEELAKGADPRVAEGRAKSAELRALKGTWGRR